MGRYSFGVPARAALLATLGLLVGGCSQSLEPGSTPSPTADDVGGGIVSNVTVDDAADTINEPFARAWVGGARSSQAICAGLSQSIDQAFHTDAFKRIASEDGDAYLLATRSDSRESPEYIEFCFSVDTLANYRLMINVQAPSIYEDSYFVTIDEESAGVDAAPGIYDISRGESFKQDSVRTRTQNPLDVALGVGEHTVRFYFREPNVALQGIQLVALESDDPVLDPDTPATTEVAQCAANTGLTVTAVEQLLDTYIGNVERLFVLQPSKKNTGYTVRNDWRWDTASGRGNVMCLSSPPSGGFNLVDNTITNGRLVIGSQGDDAQNRATPLLGTFIGNGGNDTVGVINGGVFDAGEGDDTVFLMYRGLFTGGAGDDELRTMKAGEFTAGAGDDEVVAQFAGTYDGGDGADSLTRQALSGVSLYVESIGVRFNPLLAPANLRVVDPTADAVLLAWDASPDARTQGYVVSVEGNRDPDAAADFGEFLNNVSLNQTGQTQYPLGEIYSDNAVFLVRAYTELEPDSFLYSEPVAIDYQAPTDDTFLSGLTLLGNTKIDYAIQEAGLLPGSDVLAGVEGVLNNDSVPLYIELGDNLGDQTPVFNTTVSSGEYRHHMAGSLQYVVAFPFNVPPSVYALSDDGRNVEWTRELSLPPFPLSATSPGRSQCTRAIVTQDDKLACIPLRGGIELFNPSGSSDVFAEAALDYYGALVDGDGGVVVQVNDRRRTPLTQMTVVRPALQQQQSIPLAMSSVLNVGERAEPVGIAVSNGVAIISGVILDDTCGLNGDCPRYEDDSLAYFIVSASISTGELSNFQRFGLEQRVGSGVGKVLADEVLFFGRNTLTRYELESLQLIERLNVPGTVLDASTEAIVSRSYRGESFTVGSEFYLIAR